MEYGKKHLNNIKVRFAFCFPDDYEIGMSHLGMKILYHILNKREEVYCERAFAPWVDMEQIMREKNMPLYTLETYTPLSEFDMVGFTLQYEMSYTNILNMLELGRIPVLSKDRTEGMPFVIAGGPCACNPEPLADFVDFFVIGEGEEVILEIVDEYISWKEAGESRAEFLKRVSKVEGVYVPSFYDISYNEDGTIKDIIPANSDVPGRIRRRIIKDLIRLIFRTILLFHISGLFMTELCSRFSGDVFAAAVLSGRIYLSSGQRKKPRKALRDCQSLCPKYRLR